MDIHALLRLPREHRRTFVLLMLALSVILLLIDGILSSQTPLALLLNYARGVASAIIVSLLVMWLVSSLLPPLEKQDSLTEVEPKNINKEFDVLLGAATRWRYKGNFGRYMRSKVLPTLAGKNNMHVSACIIDPANKALCNEHATYRGQIHAVDKGVKYTGDSVALEAIVTIVICAWYVANTRMSIELFLSRVFDPVRIDASDDAMILTVEDRRAPALKVTRNHFTYEHFDLQMQFSRTQARKIQIAGVRQGIPLADIGQVDVENALHSAGLGGLLKTHSVQSIISACRASKNPYET